MTWRDVGFGFLMLAGGAAVVVILYYAALFGLWLLDETWRDDQ